MRIKLHKLMAATKAGVSISIENEYYLLCKVYDWGKQSLKIQKEPIYLFTVDREGKEAQIFFPEPNHRSFIENFLKVENL